MKITKIRLMALALMASSVLAGGLASSASAASAADGGAPAVQPTEAAAVGDGAASATVPLPPRDPGTWFIKANGLNTTALFQPPVIRVKLWNMPSTINPIYVHVLWHFNPIPSMPGWYIVENHNGGCLDVVGDSQGSGAEIAIRQCDGTPSQQWMTPTGGPGKWALKNKWSGLFAVARNPVIDGRILTQQAAAGGGDVMYFDMPFYQSIP